MLWPEALRPLVLRHGEAEVTRAGIETLGYPSLWTHTANEFLSIQERLGAA